MDEISPWIVRLARLGYASIGAVYGIIGMVTLTATFGGGAGASGARDAFGVILRQPFGKMLLFTVAAGMAGYAAWRYVSAIKDSDGRGSDAKGLAVRTTSFFRGLFYSVAAFEAARMALRGGGGDDGNATRHWTGRLMDKPFGRTLALIAGLIVIGIGIYQMSRAWRSRLGKKLRLQNVTPDFRRHVIAICRFGIAARAVVFLVIGYSIVKAAWKYRASAAADTAKAFDLLASASQWLLALVAVGFIAYGVYQLVNARYRLIHA